MSAAHRRRQATDYPDDDDNDDQPTPKVSASAALAAETPAARLRALLSRVPNNKPLLVPPRSDLVDSDVDTTDDEPRPPSPSASISLARESLRDIFMRARREPGDTPQKDKTLRPRRGSFDELDQQTRVRRPGKRRSLSDEELETLPSDLRQPEQPFASGSQTMSIDNLRERLYTESQTQLQDQSLPSLYEQSTSTTHNLNASQATPPAATSTPHGFARKTQTDSNLPSQLDSQMAQSNLLDTDSEMQQAIENLESEGDYGSEFDHVPFPPGHAAATEPPTPPPGSTPSRSRIPLTRSRLNSLDKTYTGLGFRRTSGETQRPVSRTSSISSSISFCSDEAERIRERERDWNKPKAPVRPSTPELKEGHRHGRFSSRMDSPMVGGSSARRASFNGADELSSLGSQAEHHERMTELDRERMHEREREWNKRRPRLSHPSPKSLSKERTASLTHISRPDSAMSMSSTTSLQRQHSFSPSGSGKGRMSTEPPPEEYLHERERNWNAPRPKWLQSPEASIDGSQLTSLNGRRRADSLRSTESWQDYSPSHSRSQSFPHPNMLSPSRSRSRSDQPSQIPSPSSHAHSRTRSVTSPAPGSRPSSRNSLFKPTQIPTRSSAKSAQLPSHPQNGDPPLLNVEPVNHAQQESRADDGSRLRVDRDSESVQELTPTIRTINPPPLESPVEAHPWLHLASNESANDTPLPAPKPQDSPPRSSRMTDTMSFLQTPPRLTKTSDSASFEFQSPSPPKGLPELPGPPSMSDEEEEDLVYDSIAWEQTSGQSVAEHADVGNATEMKTPRPPGAWLATPSPADNVAHTRGTSTVSSETEYDGGLATPVSSLSRASVLQTPLPPGAWMPTPATARKSILRVRFEQPPSESTETEQSISSTNSESSAHASEILKHSPSPPNKVTQSAEPVQPRSRTPDLQMPVAKPQSPKSPRKSPKIRVMDAFGREAPDYISREVEQVDIHKTTPRNRSAIRIVDAMGREVNGEANKVREDEQSLPSPLNRREALMRVRQGLSDLVEGIEEINRATTDQVDEERIKKLDELSQKARTKREELATRLYTAESELHGKTHHVRVSNATAQPDRRTSWIPTGFIWVLLLILQTILIFIMFRFAMKHAKDMFLSTYYDPFYPDLHLYTIRPDTHQVPPSSWISILDTLQRDGWKAALVLLRNTISIFIYDLRTRIWETWDETQPVASWPPT